MSEKLVNSVKKAFDILDILAFEDYDRKGMSLKELSDKTDIKPNTLHGLLKTMVSCGYAEKSGHLYRSGKRCAQIGIVNRFQFTPEISNTINGVIKRLCLSTGEGVSFYVLDNGDRINYINYQSDALIKVDYTMLNSSSIYAYPSGKILVAFCSEDELKMIIKKHGFPGEYWNGISDINALRAEIDRVREQRILKQRTEDNTISSYAMAVFANGRLLGSLGVYMPGFRATEEKEKLILARLEESAAEIEKILSGR